MFALDGRRALAANVCQPQLMTNKLTVCVHLIKFKICNVSKYLQSVLLTEVEIVTNSSSCFQMRLGLAQFRR